MQRNTEIIGIILSSLAMLMIFWGIITEVYFIAALSILLLFVSVALVLIGLVMNGKEQKKIPSTRLCPTCGREIPFDAIVCPFCQCVLNDVQRHEN
jgi:hypothetical protein